MTTAHSAPLVIPPPPAGRDIRRRLYSFGLLTAIEFRLFVRDPGAAFFSLAFPLLLLVANNATGESGGDEASHAVPILTGMVLGMIGLVMIPAFVGEYRHTGVLRRLMATPGSPTALLLAITAAQLAVALLAMVLLLAAASGMLGMGGPGSPVYFALAWALGAGSLAAVGFLIAALAPTPRSANGIGFLLFFPMMFVSGAMVPKESLPETAATIGEWTPMGPVVAALRDAWAGDTPQPLMLAAMAAVMVACTAVATRLFRF